MTFLISVTNTAFSIFQSLFILCTSIESWLAGHSTFVLFLNISAIPQILSFNLFIH